VQLLATIEVPWLGRQEVQGEAGLLNFARPTMPIRSPLPAAIAALLCISLPAGGQDHTPDRARKTGTVAPTSVRVSFEEWTVPTTRSFPHDPLAAADGAIWYTGQMASTLGAGSEDGCFQRISDEDARLGSS
jgi:hypothetical protein